VRCDVLVVGGGPAGSSAARNASEKGADVVLIDRRRQIGVPVQCAGYIPARLPGELDIDRSYLVQPVEGMQTYLKGELIAETSLPGFTIHRDRFDDLLLRAAIEAGSTVLLNSAAVAKEKDGVVIRAEDRSLTRVNTTVIIGADGPKSTVARWAGADPTEPVPGVQATVGLTRPMSHTEVHFEPEIFGGYGWLFPKGNLANAGLALKRRKGDGKSLKALLDWFIDKLRRAGKIADPVFYAGGWIPTAPLRTPVYRNMMLVGDAAGHTHPVTGAGIFSAICGGTMAGRSAAAAVSSGDMNRLKAYPAEFAEFLGSTLVRGTSRRSLLEREWANLDSILKYCWIAFREYYGN